MTDSQFVIDSAALLSISQRDSSSLFLSALFIPTYVVIASIALLLLSLASNKFASRTRAPDAPMGFKGHISALGGPVIFAFLTTRFLLCLALSALTVASLNQYSHQQRWIQIALLSTYIYSTLLAIATLSTSLSWSRNIVRHLTVVLFAVFTVYVYRDLYPLATFTLSPQDEAEGQILWVKIAFLFLAGMVIPLSIPKPYIPVDPEFIKPPTSEQTASWLSSLLFVFLDATVVKAYRTASLAYEDFPPLADSDHAEVLKKQSFPHIDPAVKRKRRNLFFSLIWVFKGEFLQSALVLVILAITDFAAPVGVKQLLAYLETRGADAVMKPWFWVTWLFLGPMFNTLASERYMYVGTRMIVRAEAILTELIFEHALRIRVKAETSEKASPEQSPATPASQISSSPADSPEQLNSVETSDDDDDSKTAHSSTTTDTPSRETTLQASSSSPSSSRRASSANLKKDAEPGKVSPTPAPAPPADKETKNITGKINNLVTTDMQNIVDGREFIRLLIHTPVQVSLSIVFLHAVLGWSAFVGLSMIVILFPLPGYLAKMVQKAQKTRMKMTDARVQTVTETMGVLRMIKMFGWETLMKERILEKREEELTYIKRLRLLDLLSMMIKYQYHTAHDYASNIFHITLIMKQSLTASKVFSSMVVFGSFSRQLQRSIWILNQSVIGKTSLDRVTEFLYDTELLDAYSEQGNQLSLQVDPLYSKQDIGFHKATFSWSNDHATGSTTPSSRRFLLTIEDLVFKRGSINLILGATGSGKTSVLMALLSEMHFMPSEPDSWYSLPRDGGVAYAAQESWVQNATIKENIVFGADFDEERYKKVIYQCALERDLSLFQAGDETEVGEKGLTLSGGQKARVTLARAVYSKAEIILLDDVLAALDVHTSKWIVDKCFKGDLLEGRTVILVTHNVVLVRPIAGFVVSIKDGRVLSQGTVSDALSKDKALAAEIKMEEEIIENEEEVVDSEPAPSDSKKSDGKLIVAEEVQLGRVGWPAFKLFLKGLGGKHTFLFFAAYLAILILSEGSNIIQVWFLGFWARQYEQHDSSEVNVLYYVGLYALILFVDLGAFSVAFIIYLFGTLRMAKSVHKQLVEAVLSTTLRWLDTTPTSRVITRCTQDMREIDGMLPQIFEMLIRITLGMSGQFYSVILFTPAFLGPGVLFAVLSALCGTIYLKAQLPIKRVQSNSKAPVLAHFGTAVAGIVSIRAYGVQDSFITESMARINYYSRPSRIFWNLNRWVDVRLDALGNLFSSGLAAYLVYVGHGDASDTGFSLNMAVGFSSGILFYIRIFNMFEIRANSLERINGYITIEQEAKPTKEGVPPAYWPSSGELRVENLSARYSPDGPKVLSEVSFHVKSGERIGVVGRTGSGKSSLMLSLLRCIYTEGEVYYDGVPTASVNLDDLRSNMTIIPQMPELLSGTVRRNLDPFDQFDDAALYDALRSAGLYSIQSGDEDSRIDLETAIASGGTNLSVGQRQILALARAMVRGSKLLILDEATSAIDYKTDSVIQSSLRNELKGDVTLITVAHRLQTIMDADRIMVLDAGKIVEYGSPKELLKNQNGHLRALVDESSDKERLYAMAEHTRETPIA